MADRPLLGQSATDDGPMYDVNAGCPLGLFFDPENPAAAYGCACPGICYQRLRAPQRYVLMHILARDLAWAGQERRLGVEC